jgi:hypothetical protein
VRPYTPIWRNRVGGGWESGGRTGDAQRGDDIAVGAKDRCTDASGPYEGLLVVVSEALLSDLSQVFLESRNTLIGPVFLYQA